MSAEIEIVRKVLSELNNAPYGPTRPRSGHLGTEPKWYVTFLDGTDYGKSAHAATVWADGGGSLWIESAHLGNTTGWVEEAYGERGAVQAMDNDYRKLTLAQIQSRMKSFPKVNERIQAYRRAAEVVSKKSSVRIEMVSDGRADMAWFLFRAQIHPREVGEVEGELRKAVAAMREVYHLTHDAYTR